MNVTSFVLLAIAVGLALYVVMLYNNLVRLKHNVSRAWSNIDVLLKQRHDELPKLIETCKQYMKHEREVLPSWCWKMSPEQERPWRRRANPVMSAHLAQPKRKCASAWATCLPLPKITPT